MRSVQKKNDADMLLRVSKIKMSRERFTVTCCLEKEEIRSAREK